jgi:hypothetical protein
VGQIRWRRRALGLSAAPARGYSVGDDAAIRAAYTSSADLQELAARLGRSTGALRLRAAKLGLYRPDRRARWSHGEDAALRDGYDSGLSCREIARELPGRTLAAVAARARKLGLGHPRRLLTVAGRLGLPSNALATRLPDRRHGPDARAQPSGQR